MFEYVLPVEAASKPDDKKKPPPKGDHKKPQPIKTQAIPEKPGDPLGYDPKKIPVETIPDD